ITAIAVTSGVSEAELTVADTGCSVAIVHHQLPGIDGLFIAERLGETFGGTLAVLLLAETSEDPGAANALQAGARGYLTRSVTVHLLRLAVHGLAAGGLVLEPSAVADVLTAGHVTAAPETDAARILTPRERVVFDLLAEGLSNAEIAAELSVAASTVKKHVSAVLRKLELRDRQHAAVVGNRRRGPPPAARTDTGTFAPPSNGTSRIILNKPGEALGPRAFERRQTAAARNGRMHPGGQH
ncbi:response regulator transcription factor, partial [Frankia sp. Cr1]|uniref:response regulator transcription factor n=1 Tax=Frankia sp. Cr1 TaxID=3073931 RepID=UPI002AD29DAE